MFVRVQRRAAVSSAAKWGVIGVLLAVWWVLLAPVQLGGRTVLIDVVGISMEPGLRTGDLVVAHVQPQYQVGDVVAFRAEGRSIIHRIVGGSAESGWTTRGDNNSANDPWVVPQSAIAGRMDAQVPGLGTPFRWMVANPLSAALLAAGLVMLPAVRLPRGLRPRVKAAISAGFREGTSEGRLLRGLGALMSAAATLAALLVVADALASGAWSRGTGVVVAGLLVAAGLVMAGLRRLSAGPTAVS